MMNKQHSRIGLVSSLVLHSALIGGGFAWLHNHKIEKAEEQSVLSMEMVAALLEQPQVAVAPEPEETKEEPVPEPEPTPEPEPEPEPVPEVEPEPIPEPIPEPPKEKPKPPEKKKEEKPKEQPKPKKEKPEPPKQKPKEPPKEKPKPIKAVERGPEIKQGIVAKAIPNAAQGPKVVAGVPDGQRNGSQNASSTGSNAMGSGGNANDIAAYQAALQRALQRRANNSYPAREKMMRKMGTVKLKFTVTSSGKIANVSVTSSSGNANLDAAAVRSAEGLQMPPPPPGFPTVNVPVRFSIE